MHEDPGPGLPATRGVNEVAFMARAPALFASQGTRYSFPRSAKVHRFIEYQGPGLHWSGQIASAADYRQELRPIQMRIHHYNSHYHSCEFSDATLLEFPVKKKWIGGTTLPLFRDDK